MKGIIPDNCILISSGFIPEVSLRTHQNGSHHRIQIIILYQCFSWSFQYNISGPVIANRAILHDETIRVPCLILNQISFFKLLRQVFDKRKLHSIIIQTTIVYNLILILSIYQRCYDKPVLISRTGKLKTSLLEMHQFSLQSPIRYNLFYSYISTMYIGSVIQHILKKTSVYHYIPSTITKMSSIGSCRQHTICSFTKTYIKIL